jgi:hypothetical protein
MTTKATPGNYRMARPAVCSTLALLAISSQGGIAVDAFQPSCVIPSKGFQRRTFQLYSSVGDGTPRPPPGDDGDKDESLDDFLNPKEQSENLQKAREYMSDTSLPISFEVEVEEEEEAATAEEIEEVETNGAEEITLDLESSALVNAFGASAPSSLFASDGSLSAEMLAKNPYMQVVSKLSPSELISKFTASANPRVQEAVRSTVLGLIGSLPKMAFDTTTITTGQRLASLMFQLQMTGYMFKNAEYRLSLSQSLGASNGYSSNLLLAGSVQEEEGDEKESLSSGKVKGKVKIRYGDILSGESSELGIEVDAAAYMSELRSEVSKLKEELQQTKETNEEALRKDLLLYIRTLPAQELKSLTNTMSQDVMVSMKGLVQAVLSGIGDGQIGPETVTEQSGEAMAQLCMWQLAVGYNLRELEVREEMKQSLKKILNEDSEGGVDLSKPGTME